MVIMQRDCFNKICLFATVIGTVLCSSIVEAQIVPDNTLGSESSVVTPQQLRDLIEGGAIRGENLFHSFSEFSISEGQQVYFANPNNITNILTRVTGNNISEIFGRLGVDGGANLFLLNPNGIVFGENASLDINGSFLATTAESVIFDNGEFSAVDTDAPPLLTVNFAPGLQYGSKGSEINNQAVLEVGNGKNLSLLSNKVDHTGSLVAPGGFIEISGTDVDFSGTVDTRSPDGTVGIFLLDPKNILIQEGETISGVSISQALANSDVVLQADNDITVDDDVTSLSNNNLTFLAGRSLNILDNRTIFLSGGNFTTRFNDDNALATDRDMGIASFVMNPTSTIITNGGDVNIEAGSFGDRSQIDLAVDSAIITGNPEGDGGDINLTASGDINTGFLVSGFINDPDLALVVGDFVPINTLPGTDNAGDINVNSSNGAIASTNFVLANALGEAGNITFDAAENLTLEAPGELGRIGNISSVGLTSGEINLLSGATLQADDIRIINRISGDGVGAGINLTGESILLEKTSVTSLTRNESQAAELGTVQNATGGGITVEAREEVLVSNSNISTTADFGSADAGDLTLNTGRLKIIREPELPFLFGSFNVAVATSSDDNSSGDAGDLTINATESVELIGDTPGAFTNSFEPNIIDNAAFISASSEGTGKAGDLTINTARLSARDRVAITTFTFLGEGGDLTVNAEDIFLQGNANLSTATLAQDAGDLSINGSTITLSDGAAIATVTFGTGNAGNSNIVVDRLNIDNGSTITSSTVAEGNAGKTTITATEELFISGTSADDSFPSSIGAFSLGSGEAGVLAIESNDVRISQGADISTFSILEGSGGNIQINSETLKLDNGTINASTATSQPGGDITIRATESVRVTGAGFDFLLEQIINPSFAGTISLDNFTQGIYTVTASEGAAGDVLIETPNFTATDGGLISTTTLGTGEGGNITIDTTNLLEIDNSLLATGTFTNAASGNINLNAQNLVATRGAQAITTTFSSGRAGNLTVNVSDSIDLIDPSEQGFASGLFASSFQTASGTGGDITITTGDFNIVDGAAVSVSGEGEGDAGNISIDARSIFLDNGLITATSTSGSGGNITLQIAENLILNNNSQISTRAGTESTGGGDGGNIDLAAEFIIASPTENSDITANAFQGNGGNINITTQQLFGLEFRLEQTSFSDITASSQFGIDGAINIEILELDPANNLTNLPETPNDSADQIVAGCPADAGANFTVTGRGGLPANPQSSVSEEIILQAFETGKGESDLTTTDNVQPSLVEAQEWIINEHGKVELIASSNNNSNIGQKNSNCHW